MTGKEAIWTDVQVSAAAQARQQTASGLRTSISLRVWLPVHELTRRHRALIGAHIGWLEAGGD
jgi:hypothetical protein